MTDIKGLLGDEAEELLSFTCKGITADQLNKPGGDIVERVYMQTDRSPQVLRNLQSMFGHGRLGDTGYVSILPVDQGIEHSGAASFAPNPIYFDPENIIKLAIEGGCNAVATTYGVLGTMSRKYAHKIPFIVKINHNELMTYPNEFDQIMFGTVEEAYELGAAGVGATIYFGSPESHHQIIEVAEAFHRAHQLGMFTVLWCYLRNNAFKVDGVDYHDAADLTAQANHLGVTIEADIIKQKLPTKNGGRNSSTAISSPSIQSTTPVGRSRIATWAESVSLIPAASPRVLPILPMRSALPSLISVVVAQGSSPVERPSNVRWLKVLHS